MIGSRGLIAMAIALLAAVAGSRVMAHHSHAMFDMAKTVNVKGTVKEFMWTNPHSYVVLVAREAGKEKVYQFETSGTSMLRRRGWRAESLKPGDAVDVQYNPLRDGSNGGLFISATFADGTVLASGAVPQALPPVKEQR
jgi:hypothetical protein